MSRPACTARSRDRELWSRCSITVVMPRRWPDPLRRQWQLLSEGQFAKPLGCRRIVDARARDGSAPKDRQFRRRADDVDRKPRRTADERCPCPTGLASRTGVAPPPCTRMKSLTDRGIPGLPRRRRRDASVDRRRPHRGGGGAFARPPAHRRLRPPRSETSGGRPSPFHVAGAGRLPPARRGTQRGVPGESGSSTTSPPTPPSPAARPAWCSATNFSSHRRDTARPVAVPTAGPRGQWAITFPVPEAAAAA